MAVNLSPIGGVAGQFFDNNGDPLTGGKIYTYSAGTTTPQATYTSSLGVTPHANPIILDAAGRVPGGEIWLTDSLQYKFVIQTSNNVLIGTYDNITGINSNFVNYLAQTEVQTATAGQTVFTLTTVTYQPGTNSLSVFVDGVNQYLGTSYAETNSTTVTFSAGLHVGAEVKFTSATQIGAGSVSASSVSYTPSFTGATAQNVQTKLEQYVSVKDFGAVGDNATDDTAAIQAALSYAQISGKSLYIPAGTYIVSSTSSSGALNITTGVQIFGDGASSILKLKTGSTGTVIYAYAVSAYTGLHLRDFVVDGNNLATGQLDVGLIQILNASDFIVDNVTVKNGTRASAPAGINGIAVADTAGNVTNGTIQNCLVENCSKALINWTTNARNGLIQNCVLRNASGNGLAPGLQINGGQNVKVIANHIYSNEGSGVLIATDGAGVAPQFPILIGNHIYGNGTGASEGAGVKVARAFGSIFGRVIIANNHIYENGVNVNDNGIVLLDDANVIIQGNYVYKNKLAAVSIGGTTSPFRDVLIEGNVFEDNNQANISSVGTVYSTGTVSNVVIQNNRFVDTQTPSTTYYPIYTAAGTFTNWQVSGNTFANYRNPQIVFFDTTTPAVWSASTFTVSGTLQTTDATAVYTAIAPVADNTACVLRISSLAVQNGGSNRAYYDKENAMFRAGGVLTALGAVVTYYEQESDATWGGAMPTQTSNFALASIAGKAATTINWSYTYRMEWK